MAGCSAFFRRRSPADGRSHRDRTGWTTVPGPLDLDARKSRELQLTNFLSGRAPPSGWTHRRRGPFNGPAALRNRSSLQLRCWQRKRRLVPWASMGWSAPEIHAAHFGMMSVAAGDGRVFTRDSQNGEAEDVWRPRAPIGLRSLRRRIDDVRTGRRLDIHAGPTVFVQCIPRYEDEWPASPRRSRSACSFDGSGMVRLCLCQMGQPD